MAALERCTEELRFAPNGRFGPHVRWPMAAMRGSYPFMLCAASAALGSERSCGSAELHFVSDKYEWLLSTWRNGSLALAENDRFPPFVQNFLLLDMARRRRHSLAAQKFVL